MLMECNGKTAVELASPNRTNSTPTSHNADDTGSDELSLEVRPLNCVYRQGNTVYELKPLNGDLDESTKVTRLDSVETQHSHVAADRNSTMANLSLLPAYADVDDEQSPFGTNCFPEESTLDAGDILFCDNVPPASIERSTLFGVNSATKPRKHSGSPLYDGMQTGKNSLPETVRKDFGERKESDPVNGQPEKKEKMSRSKREKEKNVKKSYTVEEKSHLGDKSIDAIMVELGLAPEATSSLQPKSKKTGRGKAKNKQISANSLENGTDDTQAGARDDEGAELEVPVELDPDIVGKANTGDTLSSPIARSTSLTSTSTSENVEVALLGSDHNNRSSVDSGGSEPIGTIPTEMADAEAELICTGQVLAPAAKVRTVTIYNPFRQFTKQQLKQMSDKEKKARWIYAPNQDGTIPLPRAEEFAEEWSLLKAKWDEFHQKTEKPVYYKDYLKLVYDAAPVSGKAQTVNSSTNGSRGGKRLAQTSKNAPKYSKRY